MERVREAFLLAAPLDQFIGARRIFGQQLPQRVRIDASDCFVHIHAASIWRSPRLLSLFSFEGRRTAARVWSSTRITGPG
jgi:hypothetical protein